MDDQVKMGMNRTGAQMAPLGVSDIERFAHARLGEGRRDGEEIAAMHQVYVLEADRIGSVPLPGTARGMVTTVVSKLKGDKPAVLIDKLGERLAFERSGVRLYEALIRKCSALENEQSDGLIVPLDELAGIVADEEAHFDLLASAMTTIGADPTAMTPCADVAGVNAMGWLQVITDPRTTTAQALNTMLSVELTDNAGWELLMELARSAGHDDLAQNFEIAAEAEARHLALVQSWLRQTVLSEA